MIAVLSMPSRSPGGSRCRCSWPDLYRFTLSDILSAKCQSKWPGSAWSINLEARQTIDDALLHSSRVETMPLCTNLECRSSPLLEFQELTAMKLFRPCFRVLVRPLDCNSVLRIGIGDRTLSSLDCIKTSIESDQRFCPDIISVSHQPCNINVEGVVRLSSSSQKLLYGFQSTNQSICWSP